MVDHQELASELPMLEKLSTQDRLKLARKRRLQQLKRFSQYEKQLDKDQNKKRKSQTGINMKRTNVKNNRVKFVSSVMLLEAAARNDIEEVRNFLKATVSADVTNEDGLTALHQCCIDDNETMMQLLIEFGANVNAQDSELWTPLHAAATCGHVHLCQYLIEKGADLLAVNADGNMPYDICEDEITLDYIENEMAKRGITQELIDETRLSSEKNMLKDIRQMAENEDDLNTQDRNGATLLHISAANGYEEVTKFLLEQRCRIDIKDSDSWQPVHAAACWGQPVILELLVRHGADLDAKTKTGETPLDICEDTELRQRILEIKDELANNRIKPKSSLSRSRSTNTRSLFSSKESLYSSNPSLAELNPHSASIRRSSMRDKSLMSWKEAREEAKLRDTSKANTEEVESKVRISECEPPPVSEQNGQPEDDHKTVNDVTTSSSNIDDIHIHITSPDPSEPSRRTSSSHPPPAPPPLAAPEDDAPAIPPYRPLKSALRVDDYDLPEQRNMSEEYKGDIILGAQLSAQQKQHSAPTTPIRRFSDEQVNEENTENDTGYQLKDKTGSMDLRAAQSPSAGTLAELKRQRMQQNFKRSDKDQSDKSSNPSVDSTSTNGTTPLLDNNNKLAHAQSNSVSPAPYHNPPSTAYGDPPLRKFKAQETEVVGGDEVKPRCCTIL